MSPISLKDWMAAMIEATCESATQMLSIESKADTAELNEGAVSVPDGVLGSFISLVSEADTVQTGFLSNKEGLAILAKAMLGMTPEEEISDSDRTDAVSEIINVVAGGVKRRLNEITGGMKLGLPMFIEGKVAHGESQEVITAKLVLGSVPVYLTVLRKKG